MQSCVHCYTGMPEEMVSVYRAVKRGYAVVAIGTHLSQAAFNFHCFNTTWPPEDHIEGPEVCMPCCLTQDMLLHCPAVCPCNFATMHRAEGSLPSATRRLHAKHPRKTTVRHRHGGAYVRDSFSCACSW